MSRPSVRSTWSMIQMMFNLKETKLGLRVPRRLSLFCDSRSLNRISSLSSSGWYKGAIASNAEIAEKEAADGLGYEDYTRDMEPQLSDRCAREPPLEFHGPLNRYILSAIYSMFRPQLHVLDWTTNWSHPQTRQGSPSGHGQVA